MHKGVLRSLANAFTFGKGDVGKAGGVGGVGEVSNALELFFAHRFVGDGAVGDVAGVGGVLGLPMHTTTEIVVGAVGVDIEG